MMNTFYVINKQEKYQLRLVEGHDTISMSDSEVGILQALDRVVKRYKSKSRFEKKIKGSERYPYSPKSIEKREKEYKELASEYSEVVEVVVKRALKEVQVDIAPKMITNKKDIKIIPLASEERDKTKKEKKGVKMIKSIKLLNI